MCRIHEYNGTLGEKDITSSSVVTVVEFLSDAGENQLVFTF